LFEAVEEGPVADRLLELTPGRSLSFILLIILIPTLLFMAAGTTTAEFGAETVLIELDFPNI